MFIAIGTYVGNTIGRAGNFNSLDTAQNTNLQDQQAWWIIGDSMQQTSESLERGPEPFYTNTVYEATGTGSTISAITTTDVTGVTNGSYMPKFGSDYYKRTGRKIVFVRSTVGGSEVHNNGDPTDNWSTSGNLYGQGKTKLANALTALGTTKPRAIVLCLGINDVRNVTTTDANILAGYQSLFSRINTDYPGVPIFVWSMGLEGNSFTVSSKNTTAKANLAATVASYPQAHIMVNLMDYAGTANSTFYQTDFLHLTQYGNDYLASRFIKDLSTAGHISNTPITYNFSAIAAVSTVLAFPNFSTLNNEEKMAVYDYVGYLDSKGDWVRHDSVYSFLFNTQTKCNQDLRRSGKQLNPGATSSWVNKEGYYSDGNTTGVIGSNFIPSTDGTASGYASNNNISSVFVKNRTSGTGVKRTLCGAKSTSATRNTYMTETDGLGQFIQTNANSTETAVTPAGGNATLFDGNRIWINRRSGIGAHAMLRFPSSYVSGSVNSVGHTAVEMTIGGMNNNGTLEELLAAQYYGVVFANGATIDYIRAMRKFREFCIDLLVWA